MGAPKVTVRQRNSSVVSRPDGQMTARYDSCLCSWFIV